MSFASASSSSTFPIDLPKPAGRCRTSEVLRLLLIGTHCKGSILCCLRGQTNTLLSIIWQMVVQMWRLHLKSGTLGNQHDRAIYQASLITPRPLRVRLIKPERTSNVTYFYPIKRAIQFPKFSGININMMPFVIGDWKTIPEIYHGYLPLIKACPVSATEISKIGYLTIHESTVAAGHSQRRPGLHVESLPRFVKLVNGAQQIRKYVKVLYWGGGHGVEEENTLNGGIYHANNVEASCSVWDATIVHPESVLGPLGNIEHLRNILGDGYLMKANELIWMTDLTPHESLPLSQPTKRQYFRFVTSNISVWYPQHNTPNPLGIIPPNTVALIDKNKFRNPEEEEEEQIDEKEYKRKMDKLIENQKLLEVQEDSDSDSEPPRGDRPEGFEDYFL